MSYPKNPLEHLSQEELTSVSGYEHPVQDEHIQNIQSRFKALASDAALADADAAGTTVTDVAQEAPATEAVAQFALFSKKRKTWKRVLAIAAVISVFALTVGFTNANKIYELYYQYFGPGAEIAQYVSEIGQSATALGFKVELLSAVNDGEYTYLFLDITDEEGDRLSEDVFINQWDLSGSRPMGGGGTELVSYDPSTKTATFAISSISAHPGDSVLFSLFSFMSGGDNRRMVAEKLDLAQLLEENEGRFTALDRLEGVSGSMSSEFMVESDGFNSIEEILELDALSLEILGIDTFTLTNIAYREGRLHIQLKKDDDRGNVGGWPSLEHLKTGEAIDMYYSVGSGSRNEDGIASHEEFVFVIERADLKNYQLVIDSAYYGQVFDDVWEIGFQVPKRMDTIIKSVDTQIKMGSETVLLEAVEISPLSVTLRMQADAIWRSTESSLEITLVYQDGSRHTVSEEMQFASQTMGNDGLTHSFVKPIRNIESIDHIIVDGTKISL